MTTQAKPIYNHTSFTKFMKNYEMVNNNEHNISDNFETIENRNKGIDIFYQEVGDNANVINMYPNSSGSGYSSKKVPIVISNNYNVKNIYLTTFDNGRIIVFYINGDYIKYIYENKDIYENEGTESERWILGDEKYDLPKYRDRDGIRYIINEINIKTIIMDDKEVIEVSPNYLGIEKWSDNTVTSNNRNNIINKLKINEVDDDCKKSLNFTNQKSSNPNIHFNRTLTKYKKGHEGVTNSILIGNDYNELIVFFIEYVTDDSDNINMFTCHRYSLKNKTDSLAHYSSKDSIFGEKIKKIEKLKQVEYFDFGNEKKKSKIYCKIYTENLHQYIVSLRIDGDRVLVDKVISEIDLNITPKGRDIFDFKLSLDSKNRTHLFLDYNEDKSRIHESTLYHMMVENKSPTGWSDPIRISTQVMSYDNTVYNTLSIISGGINVFFVDKNNTFIRSMWSRENDQWIINDITPGIGRSIKEFTSYSTELHMKDKAGFSLINEPVKISSSAQTKLMVNGETYFLDKNQEIEIRTNARGSFTIIQPAEQLGVAALSFTLPQRDPSPVAIRQYAGIKKRLSTLTGDELVNAKDSEGNRLLPDITSSTADSAAKGVRRCMELVDTAPKLRSTFKKEPYVGKYITETLLQLETLNVPEQYQPWMLDLSTGIPIYRELSEKDIQDKLTNLSGVSEWFGNIGNFILNIKNKIFEILDFWVDSTGKFIFTFIEDGVKKVFHAVVKFANDALNIASEIFDFIKLTTERVIEFIGFVFNWKDILRSKEAISHILSLQKEFFTKSTEKIKRTVDKEFLRTKNDVNKVFDNIINTYKGKNINDGYKKAQSIKDSFLPKDKDIMDKALANNPLLDYLYNPSGYNELSNSLNAVQSRFISIDDDNRRIREVIDKYSDDFKKSDAMNSFNILFDDVKDTESFLSIMIVDILGVLKNITNLAINSLTKLVDSIIEFVEKSIDSFFTIMNEPLYIPFISEIFRFITRSEKNPSINDFISLLLAIPVTILSKLLLHESLFPSEESVLQFKTESNITTLLEVVNSTYDDSMFRIKNTGMKKRKKISTINSAVTKKQLQYISAGCTLLAGVCEGIRAASLLFKNFYPDNTILSKTKKYVNCFAILINAINIACQFFIGSLDTYSVLLIGMSCFMLFLLFAYTFVSFYEKEFYDIFFIIISVIFGVLIAFITFLFMNKLSSSDIALSLLFAGWQILDGTVLLDGAGPELSVISVFLQCFLGLIAGGIKFMKI